MMSSKSPRVRAKTTEPFGGCKPSRYGVTEIAVTTSSDEARRHRLTRFSLAIRPSSYFCANPKVRGVVVVWPMHIDHVGDGFLAVILVIRTVSLLRLNRVHAKRSRS